MYRLLVVDDEKILLDSISYIVKKNFPLVEIETARSGREGIEKAEIRKPDIVFMDIKMSGINGIEAIREIKMIYRDCVFVIITAYEKFDFAREAIELGVVEYILKPVNKESTINVLNHCINIVETERMKKKRERSLKEKYENIVPLIESEFVYSLIFCNSTYIDFADLSKLCEITGEGGYIITIRLLDRPSGENGKNESNHNKTHIYHILKDVIKSELNCFIGPLMIDKIPVFVPSGNMDSPSSIKTDAVEYGNLISKAIAEKVQVKFLLGIGNYYDKLDAMIHSYYESLKALSYGKPYKIVHVGDISEEKTEFDYPLKHEELFIEKASHGQTQEALEAFSFVFNWISEKYYDSLETAKSKVIELIIIINRFSVSNGGHVSTGYMSEIMYIHDLSTLDHWCKEKIVVITNRIRDIKANHLNTLILKAREYINSNYSSQITLEDIAKEININPHYFSRLFKEETGENFIEYLTSIRIEKAKELLNTTCLSIKEICYLIGYNDPNYFCRIFKKTNGITPTEFKSMSR